MSRRPPIKARHPRLRWYLQLVRLHLARMLLLPPRERLSRAFALLSAAALFGLLLMIPDRPLVVPGPDDALHVRVAYVQWIVQIVVMIVAALISYAMRPKPKDPDVVQANVPVVEDGKGIVRIYGLVWFDDSIVLGFKQLGTIPIKAKGGKK